MQKEREDRCVEEWGKEVVVTLHKIIKVATKCINRETLAKRNNKRNGSKEKLRQRHKLRATEKSIKL